MIIEHETNPSWATPSSPARQPYPANESTMRRVTDKPARPPIARTVILGLVLIAMLAPLFMSAV